MLLRNGHVKLLTTGIASQEISEQTVEIVTCILQKLTPDKEDVYKHIKQWFDSRIWQLIVGHWMCMWRTVGMLLLECLLESVFIHWSDKLSFIFQQNSVEKEVVIYIIVSWLSEQNVIEDPNSFCHGFVFIWCQMI